MDAASLNVHRNEMGDLGSSLVFRNIGHAHAGNYSCVARNRVGQDMVSAEMAVKRTFVRLLRAAVLPRCKI